MNAATMTLREWWRDHFQRLFQPTARDRTREAYRDTLAAWERYTQNQPLALIDTMQLADFRGRMYAAGRSATTVNKHLRHLNHLLAKAGPPGQRNRDALHIIPLTPWVAALKYDRNDPEPARLDAVIRFYNAADAYFQALTVALLHTGSRVNAVTNLTPADVNWSAKMGRFPAKTDKVRRTRRKPLSECVIRHLVALRPPDDHAPILKWPRSKNHFYDRWRATADAASLTDEELFTPHDLKRLCGTRLTELGASPWAVRHMLDHTPGDVTGQHYVSPIAELRHLVDRLPQLDRLITKTEPETHAAHEALAWL